MAFLIQVDSSRDVRRSFAMLMKPIVAEVIASVYHGDQSVSAREFDSDKCNSICMAEGSERVNTDGRLGQCLSPTS